VRAKDSASKKLPTNRKRGEGNRVKMILPAEGLFVSQGIEVMSLYEIIAGRDRRTATLCNVISVLLLVLLMGITLNPSQAMPPHAAQKHPCAAISHVVYTAALA
jgi:hypothetical protein